MPTASKLIRRTVALIVSCAAATGIAACSSSGSNTPAKANQSAGNATNLQRYIGHPDKALCGGRTYTIGLDNYSDTNPFAVAFANGMRSVAAKLGCVKLSVLNDNFDAGQAVQNARIFTQKHVDGALLANVIEAAGPGMAQVLNAAHIPFASIVVRVSGHTFVTNDDQADGRRTGAALAAAYRKLGTTQPAYAIIGRYDDQGPSGVARMNGVVEGLGSAVSKAHLLQFDSKADPPTAQGAAAALVKKIPAGSPILITGINDPVANAIFQAVKQDGRASSALVSGITGDYPSGIQFVCKNPQYVGTEEFFPERWADYMLPALIAQIRGQKVPSTITVPTRYISRASVPSVYPDSSVTGC